MPEAVQLAARENLLPSIAAETVQLLIALRADDPDDWVGSGVTRRDDRGSLSRTKQS